MHSTEGKCDSTKEINDILISAGFKEIEIMDVASDRTLITGRKVWFDKNTMDQSSRHVSC